MCTRERACVNGCSTVGTQGSSSEVASHLHIIMHVAVVVYIALMLVINVCNRGI